MTTARDSIEDGGPCLVRLGADRPGPHYALVDAGGGTDFDAALDAAAKGQAHRRLGLPGAVLRLRVDRPGLARLDWRPGRPATAEEAMAVLSPLLRAQGRPALLRAAGALDGGLAFCVPPARRGSWSEERSHHPDALGDALVEALAGRYPRGCLVRLGREAMPEPPPSLAAGRVHATPALVAALADVVEVAPRAGHGTPRILVSAARPPFRRPVARTLVDADLPAWVLDEPLDGLPMPASLASALSRLGARRVGDLVALPLHRVPGQPSPDRIDRLRAAVDEIAALRPAPAGAERAGPRPAAPAQAVPAPAVAFPAGTDAPPPAGSGAADFVRPAAAAGSAPGDSGAKVGADGAAARPEGDEARGGPVLPLLVGLSDALPAHHRAMMRGLMGLDGPVLGLKEAADLAGLTLERCRQVCDRMMRAFAADPRGAAAVAQMAEAQAETPLRLDALGRAAWAAGMDVGTVEFLVRRAEGHGLRVAHDHETGESLVTPMSTAPWNTAVGQGRAALNAMPPGADRTQMARAVMRVLIGLPETYQACVIARLLPPGYVPVPPRVRVAVAAILDDAPRPMSLEEVVDALARIYGQGFSVQQARNALATEATRGNDGLYAARVAFAPDERLSAIVDGAVRLLGRSGGMRGWRVAEIAAALPPRHRPVLEALGDRGLFILLEGDPRVTRVRSTDNWILRPSGKRKPRPSLAAHAHALVEAAGGPVPAAELLAELARQRGHVANLQMREHGRMVRVGDGSWGLHDRDLGLDGRSVARIQAMAREAIAKAPMALPALHAKIARRLPAGVSAETLRSLMRLDPEGPRVDIHGLVAMPQGREPVRGTLGRAVRAVMPELESVDDVIRAVRDMTGRTPSRSLVVKAAKATGTPLAGYGQGARRAGGGLGG